MNLRTIIERTRYALARWRLRQALRPIDKRINAARRAHKPVRHLIQAKRALILFGLRGAK